MYLINFLGTYENSVGRFQSESRRGRYFQTNIGNESSKEISEVGRVREVNFTISENLVVKSKMVPPLDSHK